MFKQLSICAAFIAFTMPAANAQQREAILQKVEVPGAPFDLVLATAKSPAAIFDLAESPDALVIHLVGGELALGFESAEEMLKASDILRSSVGAFHFRRDDRNARVPAAVYVIAKGDVLASAQR